MINFPPKERKINVAYDMNEGEALEALARATPQWLAGFFDGEGCVSVRQPHPGDPPTVRVTIAQAEPKVMAVIAFKFSLRIIENVVKGRRYFGVSVCGRSALPFLNTIKDFVVCKRRQVEAAIELLNLVSRDTKEIKEETLLKRQELAKIIRESNGAVNRVMEVNDGVHRDT
jgi:hypothetical protein